MGYTLNYGRTVGVDYIAYPMGGAPKWHGLFGIAVGEVETRQNGKMKAKRDEVNQDGKSDSVDRSSQQYHNRAMQILSKQHKVMLYVRVFENVQPTSRPTESSSSTDLSSSSQSSTAACDLSPYSISVTRLRSWYANAIHGIAQSQQMKEKAAKAKLKPNPNQLSSSGDVKGHSKRDRSSSNSTTHIPNPLPPPKKSKLTVGDTPDSITHTHSPNDNIRIAQMDDGPIQIVEE